MAAILSSRPCHAVFNQHHRAAALLPPTHAAQLPLPGRRSMARHAAANDPLSQLPQPIAEPLAYARAFTAVALRHLTESALDTAAEVSMQLAEQPRRMREFAEEVQAAADRELQALGQQPQRLLASSSSASSGQGRDGGGGSSSGGSSSSSSSPDLEALIDDLRADIAASRALLQQIRAGSSRTQAQQSRR